jgi:L-fuconolactonase
MSDPHQGVLDAHVHLWNRSRTPQDWIDPKSMRAIDRDFWLDDLRMALGRNGVAGAVIVQASDSSQETRDLLTADLPPCVRAIVGWVDLTSPSVAGAIEETLAMKNGRALAGVRHLAHIDPDPHWLRRASVSRGLDELERAGLSFDLVVTADQLSDCVRVAAEHPGLVFVLDHLGKPPLRDGKTSDWSSHLIQLAALPNVFAKLSGLTMEANWDRWVVSDLEPAMHAALDSFGPERLMFGSDWPLVEVCGGYRAWLRAAKTLTSRLSLREQSAIFSRTARTAYRLDGRSHA